MHSNLTQPNSPVFLGRALDALLAKAEPEYKGQPRLSR